MQTLKCPHCKRIFQGEFAKNVKTSEGKTITVHLHAPSLESLFQCPCGKILS